MKMTMTMSERMACISEMPAALIAVSSELSPKLPNVMSDARRIASGNACGISISPMYQKNCANTSMVRPLPMSSSTYLHRNCIISTNWQMKNVPAKSRPNCLAMNMSSFLILSMTDSRIFWFSLQKYEENVIFRYLLHIFTLELQFLSAVELDDCHLVEMFVTSLGKIAFCTQVVVLCFVEFSNVCLTLFVFCCH